jgi:hypothetical protein
VAIRNHAQAVYEATLASEHMMVRADTLERIGVAGLWWK